ncbi:MAG TPA: TMEM165/GDT1 family protein [Allosphingosinicella sp.]|nr:TMEM165/GDT1 family protein [Allosphingosinicella sp.]
MEALLTSFVAALLGEWGDKTQLLVIALAVRYRRPGPILAGVAVAALANSLLAAYGGTLVHGMIVPRAVSMLVALALIFAGSAGLIRPRPYESAGTSSAGPFLVAAASFFVLEFGDKTQFLTFALAARFDSFLLAAAGATAGILASSLPAATLGEQLARSVPLKGIRIGLGILFLAIGLYVGVSAARLT